MMEKKFSLLQKWGQNFNKIWNETSQVLFAHNRIQIDDNYTKEPSQQLLLLLLEQGI